MGSGNPPFESGSTQATIRAILRGIGAVRFPLCCRGNCGDLIRDLLQSDPDDRGPAKAGGVENITLHAWYRGFDWSKMRNLELEPPYVPPVRGNTDLGNFDVKPGNQPAQIKYVDDGTGWDKNFSTA